METRESEDVVDCSERGQPVLVGTTSIEASELLSSFLKKKKIKGLLTKMVIFLLMSYLLRNLST